MIYIGLTLILAIYVNSQRFTVHRHNKNQINYLTPALRAQMINFANSQSTIGLGNDNDDEYYITMSIGTPPQELNFHVDTGSNVMWIALNTSGMESYFNGSQSSTFNNTQKVGSIHYGAGSVYGTYGTQVIGVLDTPINNLTQNVLWVDLDVDNFNFPNIAGLVAMGYTTIPNFLDLAYSQGQIETSAFTLSLRNSSSLQSSYLYYNKIPQQITSNTIYLPVIQGGFYWQLQIIGVIVGGIQMSSYANNEAIFDSGTSLFYLNTALFNQVVAQFFSNCNNALQVPLCLCSDTSNWPILNFLLDGIVLYIYPEQYIGAINSTYCTYNFGAGGNSQILLGDTLFFNYNVSYSKITQQIGFSGEISNVDKIIPVGTNIAQYVLLAIIVCIIAIGTLQLYWLSYLTFGQKISQPRGSDMEIGKLSKNNANEPLLGKNLK